MRTTLKHTLAACIALGALMLTGTACTQDDPLGGNNPAGTQLLQLGKVTIAGTTTATRSTDAATRADAPGYTGIRKSSFVAGDVLTLTLDDGKGNPNSSTKVKATLDGTTNRWTLLPAKTYFTPGTTVSATHTATVPTAPAGTVAYGDDLVATNQKPLADGTPLALTLTHANAMVEVTPPTDIDYKDLTISATPSGAADAEVLSHITQGTGTDLRHHTIAPVGATLNSISLKVNGMVYTTTLTQVVEANKRYPITLTITGDKLVASVAAGTSWEVGGDVEGLPTGYDYYIHTVADLVEFAEAVKAGAHSATALQTADIDLGVIVNWKPIGNSTNSFKGIYNGNGYFIKNLTTSGSYSSGETNYIGFFGHIMGAKITGVHLRNCTIKGDGGANIRIGALVGYAASGCIVTLCSATGSVEATNVERTTAGGLVGYVYSTVTPNYFSRCTANVAVTAKATTSGYACGFAGYTNGGYYAGCIASGEVIKGVGNGESTGFGHTDSKTNIYHTIGCITNSEVSNFAGGSYTSAFGGINTLRSCLNTSTHKYSSVNPTELTDYVSIGESSTPPADAYRLLTKTNTSSPIKIKTLHYSPTDGYTTDVVERYWLAKGIWKDNGNDLPTIDMSYEGTINPEPIQPGNNVYPVNGYWATAPAGETDTHQWNINTSITTMASNPCATIDAAAKGWKMPTIIELQDMAGWTTNHPWSLNANSGTQVAVTAEFLAAFPPASSNGAYYWSITTGTGTLSWAICVETNNKARYTPQGREATHRIRCVQKQKAMP